MTFIEDKNEIIPNLWLGSYPDNINGLKYVFAMHGRPSYHVQIGQTLICRPFDDSPTLPPSSMLYETAQLVLDCASKGPTLVHCLAGINRSALIVALALIIRGMKPADAISLIREKRNEACLSNEAFTYWLLYKT